MLVVFAHVRWHLARNLEDLKDHRTGRYTLPGDEGLDTAQTVPVRPDGMDCPVIQVRKVFAGVELDDHVVNSD